MKDFKVQRYTPLQKKLKPVSKSFDTWSSFLVVTAINSLRTVGFMLLILYLCALKSAVENFCYTSNKILKYIRMNYIAVLMLIFNTSASTKGHYLLPVFKLLFLCCLKYYLMQFKLFFDS